MSNVTKTPRLVVSALIKKGSKYLLIKEKLEDKQDYWIIPGGGVDFGESLEKALVREIKEELGLKVKIVKFLKFHQAIVPKYHYHTIIFFYLAKSLDDKIKLGESKILAAKYFSKSEMKKLKLVGSAKWLLN